MSIRFTKNTKLVTLGRGLLNLSDVAGGGYGVDALYRDHESVRMKVKCLGKGQFLTVTIHSNGGEDISIECGVDQEFKLATGDTCKAKNLLGKRLSSIGLNEVYCTGVRLNPHYTHLYSPIKAVNTEHDSIFINGIEVMLNRI